MADFEATIKGLTEYCAGYRPRRDQCLRAEEYIEGHNVSGITTSVTASRSR